jgi:hypothetical protein
MHGETINELEILVGTHIARENVDGYRIGE